MKLVCGYIDSEFMRKTDGFLGSVSPIANSSGTDGGHMTDGGRGTEDWTVRDGEARVERHGQNG